MSAPLAPLAPAIATAKAQLLEWASLLDPKQAQDLAEQIVTTIATPLMADTLRYLASQIEGDLPQADMLRDIYRQTAAMLESE